METTNINIRMDADLKKQFEAFCNDVGLTMTAAFTLFAKKTVRDERIPFIIGRDRPNEETVRAIREVEAMKANPHLGKSYTDVDQMMGDLLHVHNPAD